MTTQAHDTATVRSGDVEIFYRRFGQPGALAPLLIAHGLSYLSYDWMAIAASLSAQREVVAFDLRGFGESSWSPGRQYGLRENSDDIIAILDQLGWADAVLVGHSMGGRVCLATAGWQAQRVRALGCLDFAPDVAGAGRRKVAERIGNQPDRFASVDEAMAYHGYRDVPPGSPLRRRWEAFLRPDGQGFVLKRDLHFRDSFRETLRTGKPAPAGVDLWAMVNGLRMPSLFVRGAESDMFAAETLVKLREANPQVQVAEIAGGHALMDDNPQGVVDAVQAFLQRSVDGAAA